MLILGFQTHFQVFSQGKFNSNDLMTHPLCPLWRPDNDALRNISSIVGIRNTFAAALHRVSEIRESSMLQESNMKQKANPVCISLG